MWIKIISLRLYKYRQLVFVLLISSCNTNNKPAIREIPVSSATAATAATANEKDGVLVDNPIQPGVLYHDTMKINIDSPGCYTINGTGTKLLGNSLIHYWETCYDTFKKLPVYLNLTATNKISAGENMAADNSIKTAQDSLRIFIMGKGTGSKTMIKRKYPVLYQLMTIQ